MPIRFCAALLALLSFAASAQTSLSASVMPPQSTVPLGAAQTFQLRWSLVTPRNSPILVTSTQGQLIDRDSGRVLAVVPTALSITGTGTVPETVRLDSQSLAQVRQGAVNLAYQRIWNDGSGGEAATAQSRVALVGSQYGGLRIRELRLRFSDGSDLSRVVPQNGSLAAYAEVSYSGRGGMLDYEWLLADPGTTRGEPVFQRIGQSRTPLRGASPLKIPGPPLPTQRSGPHILQLRLREPADTGLEATLAYYVRADTGAATAVLQLLAPAEGATLGAGSAFQWNASDGAATYQLELYAREKDERLTGVLMPAQGKTPSTPLTLVARERLAAGCRCRWRVLAYDTHGELRAVSAMREVVVPPHVPGER